MNELNPTANDPLADASAVESFVDQRQRRRERWILLLAVLGPLVLVGLNLGGVLITPYRLRGLWTGLIATTISCYQFTFCLAVPIWLAWRSPWLGGRKPSILLLLLLGLMVCNATAIVPYYRLRGEFEIDFVLLALLQTLWQLLQISATIAGFVLLRRLWGYCLVDNSIAHLACKRPVSIAELFYWMTGIGVMLGLGRGIDRINQTIQPAFTAGNTQSVWFVLAYAISTTVVLIATTWCLVWQQDRSWWRRGCWAIAVCLLLSIASTFAVAALSGFQQFAFSWMSLLFQSAMAVFRVLGIMLCLWAIRRMGLRFVRLTRNRELRVA